MSDLSEVKAPAPMAPAAGVSSEPREPRRPGGDERPIAEIVRDLWLNTETLIRQEMQLGLADAEQRAQKFKGELSKDVDQLKRELILKAAGGAIAFAGLLSLTAALIMGLAEAIPAWLSALIVGVVIAGVGVALLLRSVRAPELPDVRELMPNRAARSVKEDVRTIQEATK